MKTTAKVLKIYEDGVLVDARVIGDIDDGDREISVTYKDATYDDLPKIEGFSNSTKESIIKSIINKSPITLSMGAWYLPEQLGTTRIEVVNMDINVV